MKSELWEVGEESLIGRVSCNELHMITSLTVTRNCEGLIGRNLSRSYWRFFWSEGGGVASSPTAGLCRADPMGW